MGLIGGMARTAVIAGTATAVSNRVSRRQANRWAAQEQPVYQQTPPAAYAAPPPPPAGDDVVTQLRDLAALRDQGILTEEEFAAQKAKVLGG